MNKKEIENRGMIPWSKIQYYNKWIRSMTSSLLFLGLWDWNQWCRNWGGQGATGPPIFGRSVNPIWTGEGRLSPPITAAPPQCFSPSGITVNT